MTDWTDIRPDFTEKLQTEWKGHGFDYEEIRDWISIRIEITDASFCACG